MLCPTCQGRKTIALLTSSKPCPDCNGTGQKTTGFTPEEFEQHCRETGNVRIESAFGEPMRFNQGDVDAVAAKILDGVIAPKMEPDELCAAIELAMGSMLWTEAHKCPDMKTFAERASRAREIRMPPQYEGMILMTQPQRRE
jgi:hypothetical protein